MAINSNVVLHFFHFHPEAKVLMTSETFQSKCQQVIFQAQVGNR